jgi:hypothetical protein
MGSLFDLDAKAKEYAEAVDVLRRRKEYKSSIVTKIDNRLNPGLRSALLNVKAQREELEAMIEISKDCFKSPKTLVLQGVKVGFAKGKGKITWAKDQIANIVKQIKKIFPEQADVLIKTEEKPIKEALGNLPANDLRRLGVTVTEAGDHVVVKMADSDIDKFITAFLKETNGDQFDEDDED